MYDILSILEFISSLKFNFYDDDTFAVTPEWIHSTNVEFLKHLQNQFHGEISSCEPAGKGYYLKFRN
jgi:hypothetical protein